MRLAPAGAPNVNSSVGCGFWHYISSDSRPPFDLRQSSGLVLVICRSMNPREEPPKPKGDQTPEPSRVEEARRIVKEYANDLREIIAKLRRHTMN